MLDWLYPVAVITGGVVSSTALLTWFLANRLASVRELILENRRHAEITLNSHRAQIGQSLEAIRLRLQRIEIHTGLNGTLKSDRLGSLNK